MSILDEVRAALEAATPGPWVIGDDPRQVIAPCPCCGLIATCAPYGVPTGDKEYDAHHHYNSAIIANAPTWLAALVAQVAANRTERDALAAQVAALREALTAAARSLRTGAIQIGESYATPGLLAAAGWADDASANQSPLADRLLLAQAVAVALEADWPQGTTTKEAAFTTYQPLWDALTAWRKAGQS